MTQHDAQKGLLIAAFIVVIVCVGITQAVIELRQGEPPQALSLLHHPPTEANLRLFEKELEGRSWFARTLRPQMQYLRYLTLGDTGTEVILGKDGWWFYRKGMRYLVEPMPSATRSKTGYNDVIEAVVSFHDQLAARGIQLLVVPVPGKANVYPEKLTDRVEAGVLHHSHTRDMIADLTDTGVEVVDLLEVFGQARDDGSATSTEPLYLARDTHWTPTGMQLAVRTIANRIRELGWAQAGELDYELRPIPVKRNGDVVEMLQSPGVNRLFDPQGIACQQVIVAATGEPYRDELSSPILVLGDSFLEIYEGKDPGSAGFIAHLAHELRQPLTSIVDRGGGSTLVRQKLARKPHLLTGKKLVIWEFVERDIRFGLEGWQDVLLR